MTMHNVAAYCPRCSRVQCRCKNDNGIARTMDEYHRRHTRFEVGEPSQDERNRIDLEAAIMLIDKIAAGPGHEDAPQGERLGKLATAAPASHRQGRVGHRVY